MKTRILIAGLLAAVAVVALPTFAGAPAIAAGGNHSLAITSEGAVLSTGNNAYGQLGNGNTSDSAEFEVINGLTGVVGLEGGDFHSLAVKSDGTVWAWGNNSSGRLGDGTSVQRTSPVQVINLSGVVMVAAGGSHSLALKTNGTVWAWGLGTSGQLGNGTNLNQTTRVQVTGLSNIIAIAAGDTHSLALDVGGKVWAWGNNANGRLGNLTNANQFSPVVVVSISNIVGIAAGGSYSMALDAAGHVWAWGLGTSGQLGNNTVTTSTNVVQVTNLNSVVKITAGNLHSMALLADGTVRAWGANASGQLGNGTLTISKTNVLVIGVTNIVALAAGDLHSLGLKADGTVIVWGDHKMGQLGTGEFNYRSVADFVNGITNAIGIGAGASHTLAQLADNTTVAWGNNSNGQLGNGTTTDAPWFGTVSNLTGVVGLEGGDLHSLAVKADGTVWAWGVNAYGRLGDGTTSQRTTPVRATNLTDVAIVAGGGGFSLALKTNGTVWAWGLGTSGQLGNGTNLSQTTRVQVTGLSNVVAIAAGDTHSLALDVSGKVWAWGNNANGRLGDLTPGNRFSPVRVLSVSNIVEIAAGGSHSMALDTAGHVWAWGLGTSGQLGNNTVTTSTNAVQVTNLNSVVKIAAGNIHSLALLTNGTVRAWGGNASGQLGNDAEVTCKTNVAVIGASDVIAIAAGDLHSVALRTNGSVLVWGDSANGQLGDGNMGYNSIAVTSLAYLLPQIVITTQPATVTVAQGGTATFTVEAVAHVSPVCYQWYYPSGGGFTLTNIPVAGATNALLILTNVQCTTHAAVGYNPNNNTWTTNWLLDSYFVVVSNAVASVTSAVAVLNVIASPMLESQPQSQTVVQWQPVVFSVSTSVRPLGQSPLTYQWYFNGSALTAATGSTLTLAGVQPNDAGNYSVIVTGGIASTQSVNAALTVIVPPIILASPADNATLNTTRVNVVGTFTNIVATVPIRRVSVNGIPAFINGGNFEALNVPLAVGANSIIATMEDFAGNTNAAIITINGSTPQVDPVQLLASPVGGFAPLNVGLQASVNVPGTLQQVLYDFNGDDLADQTAADLNAITHNYSDAGECFPVATIVTSAGRFSSLGGWNSYEANRLRVNVQLPPVALRTNSITDPVDLKVATNGNLFVLSRSSATITELNTNGSVVRSLAGIGTTPQGLDVDNLGNVYVALSGDHQVAKFNPNGGTFQLDATFGSAGVIGRSDKASGANSGEFNWPYDVAVSPDGGFIFVSDTSNHRIQKFDANDGFIFAIGSQGSAFGQFNDPKGLNFGSDSSLFVVDSGNSRLVQFMGDEVYNVTGSAGTLPGQYQSPLNIASDPQRIYVADTGNNRIQKLDRQSFSPILQISSELGLSQPAGIAMVQNPTEERIYIADTGNNRVVLVKLPPQSDPLDVWSAAKQALTNGSPETALTYFSASKADNYRALFTALGSTRMSQSMSAIGTLTPISIDVDEARYYFTRSLNGQPFMFLVTFEKVNGQWKIRTF